MVVSKVFSCQCHACTTDIQPRYSAASDMEYVSPTTFAGAIPTPEFTGSFVMFVTPGDVTYSSVSQPLSVTCDLAMSQLLKTLEGGASSTAPHWLEKINPSNMSLLSPREEHRCRNMAKVSVLISMPTNYKAQNSEYCVGSASYFVSGTTKQRELLH